MTIAICWKCGVRKSSPFKSCPACRAEPKTEDDQVASIAMSTHYCDLATLARIGSDIAAGKPVNIDTESRQTIINEWGGCGKLGAMANTLDAVNFPTAGIQKKKTFWQWLVSLYTITPTTQKWHVVIRASAAKNVLRGGAWLVYGGTIAMVRTGKYGDLHPERRGQVSPFNEECFAREALVEFWEKQTVDDQATDSYLQILTKVTKVGLIREYVWRFLPNTRGSDPTGLDLGRLETWLAAEGIADHQAEISAFVVTEEEYQKIHTLDF